MNKEINKAMTQGIVFKKAKGEAEDSNGKKIKFSDFLKGTHGSDSAKWKAGLNIKKPYVIPKRRNNFQFSTFNSQLLRIFANELTWIDLYCLQPREKMLKTYPFRCRPAEKSFQVQFSHRLITNEHCQLRPVVYPLILNFQFSIFNLKR